MRKRNHEIGAKQKNYSDIFILTKIIMYQGEGGRNRDQAEYVDKPLDKKIDG